MTRRRLLGFVLLFSCGAGPALADPRDSAAVLNRCGKPLKGEETILEDTVSGGRRILMYERGTLTFNKVANIGWTFTYGSHGKQDHLTAEQMEKYLPCLKTALADAASPQPLVRVTPVQRVEVSLKRDFKVLIANTIAALGVLGIIFFFWSRRGHASEPEE
jgi:hypothetical protein